jgi:transcription initiation factor TFIIIB Brf1 subunit/transcription initiation factor TFIIB
MRKTPLKIMRFSSRRIITTCPECDNRVQPSKLEQGRFVCKYCNIVYDEEKIKEKFWTDVLAQKRMR